MRVLLNGTELAGLDNDLERRLAGGVRNGPVDSISLSPTGSIVARGRQLRLLLGGVGVAVAALLAVNLAIVATTAPDVMGYVALAAVGAIVFVGALVWVLYTLMLARTGAGSRRAQTPGCRKASRCGWTPKDSQLTAGPRPGPGCGSTSSGCASGSPTDSASPTRNA